MHRYRYMIKCRLCDASFMSYESYEMHVIEQHRDNLAYRFRPMIIYVVDDGNKGR